MSSGWVNDKLYEQIEYINNKKVITKSIVKDNNKITTQIYACDGSLIEKEIKMQNSDAVLFKRYVDKKKTI